MFQKRIFCFLEWIDPGICSCAARTVKQGENFVDKQDLDNPFQKKDFDRNEVQKKDDDADTCNDAVDKREDSNEMQDGSGRGRTSQPWKTTPRARKQICKHSALQQPKQNRNNYCLIA